MKQIKPRLLGKFLPPVTQRTIVLLTGARQTGKTTLVREKYNKLRYINFDSIEERSKTNTVHTSLWGQTVGTAVIDEVQKEPAVFDKIKYAYDEKQIDFSVLLGSSQILLQKSVRETLAGRIAIFELFPLLMSELHHEDDNLKVPLLDLLLQDTQIDKVLNNIPPVLFGQDEALRMAAEKHLLTFGGMPALLHLKEKERYKWLRDYEYTYLERDLLDLARISDLEPFRKLQKLSAWRSGKLLNFSELARDSGISVDTTRRYLEYLRLSYQAELLQPYYNNNSKSLIKTPKLYWLDVGMMKQLRGVVDTGEGSIFETMVMAELIKWIRTAQRRAELYFYRTHSGLEVDAVLVTPQGIIGIEIKDRNKYVSRDITNLTKLAKTLKKDWLGGILLYRGSQITRIAEPNIWAVPSWRLFT